MAANKHHRAIAGHVKQMQQHLRNANESASQIEQILSAMRQEGQEQQPDQQPQQTPPMPGQTNGGVSPMGGMAR